MNKKKVSKSKSDINVSNKIPRKRIFIIFIFIFLCIIGLLGRIGYLQFVDGEYLQTLAKSQQTLTETLSAKRGTIYDSKGETLAISYETDKIYINPSSIKQDSEKEIVAQGLASILEIDSSELLTKLNESSKRFLVASDVEKETVNKLNEWKDSLKFTTGISIESSTSRYYPCNTLASTILGFVGTDNQGLYGIEYSWNSFLSGTVGKSVSLKDASQSEIVNSQQTYIAAENGYDLTLTIDSNIQSIVEEHLAEAVEEYKCESGMTIAMDPSTGKILAMVDYPNYNCNDPYTPNSRLLQVWDTLSSEDKNDSLYKMWALKPVTNTYEPGSVFKIITSAIALEENIIDTDTVEFNCTGSYLVPGESTPIKCYKYPDFHGPETLTQALENSCNPAFVELGIRIGAKLSYKYYEAFGFFDKTGISLSGEPSNGGIFYDINKINDHELGTMSFGQRFTITPLQMITAVSAIANDGVLLQPQIVESMTNTDTGEVVEFQTKEVCQVVSKETADKVASMMESVVVNGTGRKVVDDIEGMENYSVGGKTGTSEPIYASKDDGYVASFLAISPVENTKIVLLVILDNPGEGINHNGGQIAAPTAGKMLAEILPYMGVETGKQNNETNSNTLTEKDLY